MRLAAALLWISALAAAPVRAEGYGPSLTVLLDFREAASPASITEIEREIQRALEPAGLHVQVRLTSQVRPDESFSDLVLVRFKGTCTAEPDPMLLDERGPGPLAFAHTTNGQVQPFGEVACDAVRRAVNSALWGDQRRNREQLFGRALGRVAAHELFHMLSNNTGHGKSGVFRPSLSGAQLIADHLDSSPDEFRRLRLARAQH